MADGREAAGSVWAKGYLVTFICRRRVEVPTFFKKVGSLISIGGSVKLRSEFFSTQIFRYFGFLGYNPKSYESFSNCAAGNIGRRSVEALAGSHELIAVDKVGIDLACGVEVRNIDLLARPDLLDELVARKRPDAIVHLAALVGGVCDRRPEEARALNTSVTAWLAIKTNVPRFVFASSAAVYGRHVLRPLAEDTPPEPPTLYGRTKLEAEHAIEDVAGDGDTHFTTLRVFNVYGHGIEKSLVERLRTATAVQPAQLFGWNNFYRDYVHVDDVAIAIQSAACAELETPGLKVVNIGSGVARSNAMLVDEMTAAGLSVQYQRTGTEDLPDYSWADIGRAAELFGFDPARHLVLDR